MQFASYAIPVQIFVMVRDVLSVPYSTEHSTGSARGVLGSLLDLRLRFRWMCAMQATMIAKVMNETILRTAVSVADILSAVLCDVCPAADSGDGG